LGQLAAGRNPGWDEADNFQIRDWRAAADVCREALRLNPANVQVRKLLVRIYLRLGEPESARRELDALLGLDPLERDDLLRWFAPLARPG
jgi:tetratricopeptide (TPR) repeat protein